MDNRNNSKKIFVISQPEVITVVGGAITVFLNFCKMLSENYDVTGICYNSINKRPELLDKTIKFVNLYYYDKKHSFSNAINKLIKKEKPDLLIYFFPNLYTESNLSKQFQKIPRILMFHSRPDFYFTADKQLEQKLKLLYTNTTTQIIFDSFKNLLPDYIKTDNVISIPNGIKIQNNFVNIKQEKKKIIYLSRIDYCKGLEFLIKSFTLIAKKHKDWKLDIYGQSQPPEYVDELIDLTKKLKLDKQIFFKGITDNPIQTLKNYDFCVFPSFFEGFGLGLAEAQSVGLPSIGLANCSGVNELIIDNYNGLLSECTPKDFAQKIEKLITDRKLRETFSQNTILEIQKYDYKKINKTWLNKINDILECKSIKNIPPEKPTIKSNIFSIEKIFDLIFNHEKYRQEALKKPLTFYQKIFSVKNTYNKSHKVITLLGIKIKIRYKKKTPRISVIMAVYNTKEPWLREAIESILNQTYDDFEFIIVNDGSKNNVSKVIKSYKDKRIIYIEQTNKGAGYARNVALEIAKGEYIAIMDSDDISLPDRFHKQVKYLDKNKNISVLGASINLFPNGTVITHTKYPKYIDMFEKCCIANPTVMFRRKDFEKYNLKYNTNYKCEDYELWSRAIRYLKFANMKEVVLNYRWHTNNSSKPTKEFIAQFEKVQNNMIKWLTDDKDIQKKIYNVVFMNRKYNANTATIHNMPARIYQKIFSVKNVYSDTTKHKILTLLGFKIKIKT